MSSDPRGARPDTVSIPARFNGPPDSGHGGYSCGVLADLVDGPCVVELRSPPPLDTALTISRVDGGLEAHAGDTLVGRARPTTATEVTPPHVPSVAEATAATAGYLGFEVHPFPTCFACGPDRAPGDGLRLFTGAVQGTPIVAAPWTPADDLGEAGELAPRHVWSALDCPSYFGAAAPRTAVLASMTITQHWPIRLGAPHVVVGWGQGSDGRKIRGASAIADPDGTVLAIADALWIELRS